MPRDCTEPPMCLSLMNSPVDCVTASNTNMVNNNNMRKAAKPKAKNGKAKGNNRRAGKAVTRAPAAQSRTTVQRAPKMATSFLGNDARIRVKHREYLTDVMGSVAYAVTKFSLNPGLNNAFPWLSSLANNYESYRFLNLAVEFETMCSTATVGSVMMAIDFDAADEVPGTKQMMLGYHNAVRTAGWSRATLTASPADLNKNGQKMTRNRPLAANLDIKTYDTGNLLVACQGFADASSIGELYLVYEVELHTPQLVTEPAYLDSARIASSVAGITAATPFGNVPTVVVAADDPLKITVTGDTITFREAGQYLIDMYTGGTTITGAPTVTGTAAPQYITGIINGGGTISNDQWIVDVIAGASLAFSFAGHLAAIANTMTRITPYYKANQ